MYAVGRLGSYITRGVSTVSGPFHPFGGAVDIVVVQQQDGSLKSSPWYVRFGKFQGVLKAKEKIVDINVNGAQADFHMYLNPRGEAYFLREKVNSEEIDAVSLRLHSGEETDRKVRRLRSLKSKSVDYNFDHCDSLIDVNNARAFSRNLGFVLERKVKEDSLLNEKDNSNDGRVKLGDSAEIAADLLETKWSTTSETNDNSHGDHNKDDGEITSGKLEASLVLHKQHFVNNSGDQAVDKVIVANIDGDGNVEVSEAHGVSLENGISKEERLNNGPETAEHLKVASIRQENASEEVDSCSVVAVKCVNEPNEVNSSLESNGEVEDGSSNSVSKKKATFVEEQFAFSDLDDMDPSVGRIEGTQVVSALEVNHTDRFDDMEGDVERSKRSMRRFPSDLDLPKSCELAEEEIGAQAKSLPNMSHFHQFGPNNLDGSSHYSLGPKRRSSKWAVLRNDASRIIKENKEQLSDSHSADSIWKDVKSDNGTGGDVSNIGDNVGKSWSLWPFRRSRSKKSSQDCKKDSDIDSGSEVDVEKDVPLLKNKMQRALTPTPEQLEALNLTEGKNTVTFKFATAVLGNQQVDARIFLWRWDTRIVISDVDGTITKSDVLGQFMPLVGRDWSHIGVTHLFSAIKENGYQILFLSARSISQAHITRQFLFNLKQDGKALPDGPVVISPDGLFPSLFREVIRRAPHEFKIACLEEIRACFPVDWNPFYAGFGNRDTDEFSYLKVGIPKGKIFIINPKGEVVVNRCVDSKSYTSLHAIVNGIFPPLSESLDHDVAPVNEEANEQPSAPDAR